MYVSGFLIPVREERKDAYRQMVADASGFFRKHGAVEIVEVWEDDVRDVPTGLNIARSGRRAVMQVESDFQGLSVTRFVEVPPEAVWDVIANRQEQWWCPAPRRSRSSRRTPAPAGAAP